MHFLQGFLGHAIENHAYGILKVDKEVNQTSAIEQPEKQSGFESWPIEHVLQERMFAM